MIKLFVYCIETERKNGTLHDFVRTNGSTHYITDEYGTVLAQGDADYCAKRIEWFESNPIKYYQFRGRLDAEKRRELSHKQRGEDMSEKEKAIECIKALSRIEGATMSMGGLTNREVFTQILM